MFNKKKQAPWLMLGPFYEEIGLVHHMESSYPHNGQIISAQTVGTKLA